MGVEGVSFYEIAQSDPGRPAILGPDGTTTYGELHAEVNRLSNALHDLGFRPRDTLATVLGNRPQFLTVLLAAMQSGLYLVPVSRHLTMPEISYVLQDSEAKAVITEREFAAAVTPAVEEAGIKNRLAIEAIPGFIELASLAGSPEPPDARQMGSLMLYTSGTTGKPKGVQRPRHVA